MFFTENEKAIIKGSRDNDYGNVFDGEATWVFSVIDASGLNPRVARGALASLVKKEIVVITDYEGTGKSNDSLFEYTPDGLVFAQAVLAEILP